MARGAIPKGAYYGGCLPISPRHTHQMTPEGVIGVAYGAGAAGGVPPSPLATRAAMKQGFIGELL
jgi:hypothetical protein